jgi:serine/threonine-protein kinase
VWLAVARGPNGFSKIVVLKSMRPHLRFETGFATMFMNEARLAARLNHPNVVQTYEVFDLDGSPIIVMEYLDGQPLSAILDRSEQQRTKGGPDLRLEMHLRVISDALSGLHYSHTLADYDGTQLGIVHRDMSPQNVFVTFDGLVKVLDFGIAKLSGSQAETAVGVVKGKLRYMAREQMAEEHVDRRADIYAVGVMLWEAATGTKMWRGMSEPAIMHAVLNREVPRPSEVNPEVAPELEAIVMKALSPERDKRHATAAELQGEIDEFLNLRTAVRPRDIGQVVATLFAERRQKTKRVIETQLSKITGLTSAEYAIAEPVELYLNAVRSTDAEGRSNVAANAPRRTVRWPIAAAAAVVMAGALTVGLSARSAPLMLSPVVPTLASPPEKPPEVRLRIRAVPGNARIYLDGQLLAGNPFNGVVPSGNAKRLIVAKADGFADARQEVHLEADTTVVLKLEKLEEPAPAKQKVRPPRPPRGAAPQPAPDCHPPYVVDDRGVKRYKLDCL